MSLTMWVVSLIPYLVPAIFCNTLFGGSITKEKDMGSYLLLSLSLILFIFRGGKNPIRAHWHPSYHREQRRYHHSEIRTHRDWPSWIVNKVQRQTRPRYSPLFQLFVLNYVVVFKYFFALVVRIWIFILATFVIDRYFITCILCTLISAT